MKMKIRVEYGLDGILSSARVNIETPDEITEFESGGEGINDEITEFESGGEGINDEIRTGILNESIKENIINAINKVSSDFKENVRVDGLDIIVTGRSWEEVDKIIDKYVASLKLFRIPEPREIEIEI